MDLLEIRGAMKTRSIYDIPLRVTFYARVSSDRDAQLNSLDNQISYYSKFVKDNKKWAYVPGYIDEGLSGMATEKREEFLRMIEDGLAGKFDLIVTKEISRFARNTLDSISFTRKLLRAGVGVYFQNDNINTLEENMEFKLTLMASLAQEEIGKLSSRVRFGHAEAIKKGVVLGNSLMFGYTKKDGRLVIDETEAVMVRKVFTLYATGKYSMKDIESVLYKDGYRNHNGVMISHSTLSKIIKNPKYKGYYVGNKVKIVDMFTKEQKFLDPSEWVMYKDETGERVPAIVSEELWEAANAVLEARSFDVKHRLNQCTHGNLLTGKLVCGHCGSPYHRKESVDKYGHRNSRWACARKLTKASACPSTYIQEKDIVPVLADVFKECAQNPDEALEAYVALFKATYDVDTLSGEIVKQGWEVSRIEQQKVKLLEYNVAGKITDDDFLRMNGQLTEQLEKAAAIVEDLKRQQAEREGIDGRIAEIKGAIAAVKEAAESGGITRQFVERNIDRIVAYPIDAQTTRLEITLKTLQRVTREIIRPDNTSKKMISDYQNQASGKFPQ